MNYKGHASSFFKKYDDFVRNEERFEDLVDLSDPKKFFVDLDKVGVRADITEVCKRILEEWFKPNFLNIKNGTPAFFKVIENGKTHYYKATPERIQIILKCLQDSEFDQVITHEPLTSGDPVEIETVHVSGFGVQVYDFEVPESRETREGMFFNYVIKETVPQRIKDQLKRYQIFSSFVDETGKRIPELEDCCFVYALKMSNQFSESTLNQIRLRICNRFLPALKLDKICKEFKIHLICHYINDKRSEKIGPRHQKFIGVKEEEAAYKVEMNLFQKHYFLEEKTPFSKYYIKNFEKEDPNNFAKQYEPSRGYRMARSFMKSGELVRYLLDNDYFAPITYGHYMVLNTEFHKYQDYDSVDYDLHYDPEFCTRLIEPNKKDKDIFYWSDLFD